MNKALEAKLNDLPRTPGVYFHKSKSGEIIYVGKAAVLRNRVRQYFQSSRGHDNKTLALVAEIALRRLALDQLWWMVTPGNPLKSTRELTPLAERIDLSEKVARDPRIKVTAFEAAHHVRFTADTLELVRRGSATARAAGVDAIRRRQLRDGVAASKPVALGGAIVVGSPDRSGNAGLRAALRRVASAEDIGFARSRGRDAARGPSLPCARVRISERSCHLVDADASRLVRLAGSDARAELMDPRTA